jgi:hypothetical protein
MIYAPERFPPLPGGTEIILQRAINRVTIFNAAGDLSQFQLAQPLPENWLAALRQGRLPDDAEWHAANRK